MKIISDDKIPHLHDFFTSLGDIRVMPGNDISASSLKAADILLTRSITSINAALLKNTLVQFVATATAGFDHLDTAWLDTQNIGWAYAPGANADTVTEYVRLCLECCQQTNRFPKASFKAGVMGVGHIGRKVVDLLNQLGASVIQYDPPREDTEPEFISSPLSDFYDCDLISLHPSLTKAGPHPSYHMINHAFLQALKPGCVLINASRGGVADTTALLKATHMTLCCDVWEHEPCINPLLLSQAFIATPHIAGYSRKAKYNATRMIYEDACQFFNKTPVSYPFSLHSTSNVYHPLAHTQSVKQALLNSDDIGLSFRQLRRNFKLR